MNADKVKIEQDIRLYINASYDCKLRNYTIDFGGISLTFKDYDIVGDKVYFYQSTHSEGTSLFNISISAFDSIRKERA